MENTDLILYKSVTVSEAESNGGRMSYTQVTSGVLNNLFPNVSQDERTDGVSKYRKFFYKNKNSAGETAANSRIWISRRSDGGDYFRIKAGTNTDTQAEADDYTNWLGAGYLYNEIGVDSTRMDVVFDTSNGVYNSSLIRLSDNSGKEEFLTVKGAGGVSWNGNIATILTTTCFRSGYPASQDVLISAVIDFGSIVASSDNWSESREIYDESTYPVVANNVGTVEDSWTLTFTNGTAFTVSGANTGAISGGVIGSGYSPVNPNVGSGDYYFQILAAGWGVPQVGDVITFDTHHAAKSFWVSENVPALTSSQTNNQFNLKLYAEGS